jgi:hypothetical protein
LRPKAFRPVGGLIAALNEDISTASKVHIVNIFANDQFQALRSKNLKQP